MKTFGDVDGSCFQLRLWQARTCIWVCYRRCKGNDYNNAFADHRHVMTFLRFSLFRAFALVALIGFLMAAKRAPAQTEPEPHPCTDLKLKSQAAVHGFLFKTYESVNPDDGACLRVYHDGKLIQEISDDAQEFYLGQPRDPDLKIPFIRNGTDVTGRGHPDMIVSSWSGGAHCCHKHYVFELEPRLTLLATIDDGDANGHFEYSDDNHRYYYVTEDIWSYWPASFAGSTSHKVLLRFKEDAHGGGFHVDMEKMRSPAPSADQWKAALKDVDDAVRDDPANERANLSSALWDSVLDLIYTGHSDLAWKFIAEVNPKALQGNYPHLDEFCGMLQSDPYWPDIEPTIKDMPPDCANAKPGRKD
jgi:hypothetical protein